MKKRNFKTLKLNKKQISNLRNQSAAVGGLFKTESCHPNGICCPTHDINCPDPSLVETCNCGTTVPGTLLDCPETISCRPNGIC